ncbi:uncharacterized protein PGTG_02342 [Puccinia graminis f. sp. tritici CRL 75-36-700-3]|uniref:PX domain-containing protein n=1 Tax=Puccinia graminis f. sp. tritici (strain CRL 75-36-700-3 / race SCCL) TaxID=418459 RepID=E3JXV6_PUCGT|nr:uncharacterized protein PGTG_02342 [Puccinia graminis f. sp. tritici CRL 75-36-700-3]EFP76881.2 hypothetical protein PGTG_02342 [Puccinia graminis f. sp. tritici CRL 75-36-700-3]
MLSSTSPVEEYRDEQFNLARSGSLLSVSNRSSRSSSSSPPNIPFKPGHLRSISSQVRVQNRIIQAVEIRQQSPESTSSRLSGSSPPALQHADQTTIKATQRRPPRETANAIQKLMQSNNYPASPSLSRDWRDQANEKARTSVDRRPGSLDSKQRVGGFQDLERIHTTRPQKLSLGVRSDNPLGSASQTEGVVSHRPDQASSTFTPLITPRQAIALYTFNPEAFSSSESDKDEEDDSEKMTPEVRFQSGDKLEIWVPDIGGGWSLGKNLTSSTSLLDISLSQVTEQGHNDWGLIPIGWYKVVESPDTPRNRPKVKKVAPMQSFSARLAFGTQSSDVLLSQKQARLTSVDHGRMDQECFPITRRSLDTSSHHESCASDLEAYSPNKRKVKAESGLEAPPSRGTRRNLRVNNASEVGTASSRSSGYFLSPPTQNASVAINKEFDPNGVHFDYQSRGIACSVTASDAMFAARQAADRHSIDPPVPEVIGQPRSSSWNPFLRNRTANRRHSIAHSYITGEEDYQQDTTEEDGQDQGCTERHEIRAGPAWKDSAPRFTVQVHSPQLQTHPSKMKAHVIYTVTSTFSNDNGSVEDGPMNVQVTVGRRYSHFGLLSIGLNLIYGEVIDLPALPEKGFTSNYDEGFIENRRRALERYLFRLTRHPILRYCPRLTTFLGCEDVEEFEAEARSWSQLNSEPSQKAGGQATDSAASSSFFSKVFHPDYNVDEPEAESSIDAYNLHTQSLENSKNMVDLEKNISNLRISIQDMAQNFQKVSSSIQRLCAGLPLPHKELPYNRPPKSGISGSERPGYVPCDDAHGVYHGLEKGQKHSSPENSLLRDLRRDVRDAGMQNLDGAMCWKEDCTECLAMTKALQLLGQSLGNVAGSYSTCATEALAPVEALIKELSFPHKNRKVLSSLHDSTKVSFSDLSGHGTLDIFESRKETVLNVVMSEIERHHQERNLDFRDMAKTLLDGQIQLHQSACEQLKEARQALEEPQLSFLGRSGPRSMNAEEAKGLQRQDLTRSSSAIFASSHNESFKTARSQLDLDQSDNRPLSRSSSVLEWINHSATYPGKLAENSSRPLANNHQRNPSIASHSSSIASSAFSSVFVKPLSAAFSSMVDLSDYLS